MEINKYSHRDYNNYIKEFPSKDGRFGAYGGAYLPSELIPAFKEIDYASETICHSSKFISELRRIRKEFQGRPTRFTIASAFPMSWASARYTLSGRTLTIPAPTS